MRRAAAAAPRRDIEALALDRLRLFFASRTELGDALAPLDLDAREQLCAPHSSFLSDGFASTKTGESLRKSAMRG